MIPQQRLKAYGKINLGPDVLGRREDGYHQVRMIMQTVGLHDGIDIYLKSGRGIRVESNLYYLPNNEQNLAYRAAALLMEEFGVDAGLSVRLRKFIPVAAGMAGGSSDGAAVLRLLRRALAPELPDRALEAMALQGGSDVPYCVRGGTALAEGRGEVLTGLPALPDCFLVVCKPSFPISTPELFAQVRLRQLRCHPDTAGPSSALYKGDLSGVCPRL